MQDNAFDQLEFTHVLEQLLTATDTYAWVKDLSGRYIWVSAKWLNWNHKTREEVIGHTDFDFRLEMEAERVARTDREVLESGARKTYEGHWMISGTTRMIIIDKFPVFSRHGQTIGTAGLTTEAARNIRGDVLRQDLETLLEGVLGEATDFVLRVASDMTLIDANAAFRRVRLGGEPVVAGIPLRQAFEPAEMEETLAAVERTFQSRQAASFEHASKDVRGDQIWRKWTVSPISAPPGQRDTYQIVGRIITEEKLYEIALERLLDSGHLGALPLEAAILSVLTIGNDYFQSEFAQVFRDEKENMREIFTQHRARNPAFFSGEMPRSSTIGAFVMEGTELLSCADLNESRWKDHYLVTSGGACGYIAQRLHVDGQPYGFVSFISARPSQRFTSTRGRNLARLMGNLISVALEREAKLQEVIASRSKLALILDHVPARISFHRETGETIIANTAALQFQEALGIARGLFSPVAHEALSSGEPQFGRLEQMELEPGRAQWVRTDAIPFQSTSHERHLLLVGTDVTPLVEKERALALANERLNQFAYVASHDLQEPFRKISTFLGVLDEALASDNRADMDFAMKVIHQAADRSSRLIRDLLAWSRSANQPVSVSQFDLSQMAREVWADVSGNRQDIKAFLHDELRTCLIAADRGQIRQLLTNLFVNAFKYRHAGRPLELTLRLMEEDKGVRLEVADNGIGFDPQLKGFIFEPFRRLHSDRTISGSGIGLAICRSTAEAHGWTISADGIPDRGATFSLHVDERSLR